MNGCYAKAWAVAAVLIAVAAVRLPAQESGASLLTAGKAALEDELYGLAQKQFERFLEREGNSPEDMEEACSLLGRSLYEQRKYAEALDRLKPKKTWPKSVQDSGSLAFWRAMALYAMGRCDEALAEIAALETRGAEPAIAGKAIRLRAWCHLKRKSLDEAVAAFAQYDRTYGATPEGAANLLEWARALLSANRTEPAREVLDRLLQRPADLEAVQEGRHWQGLLLLQEKKWAEAREILAALGRNEKAPADLRAQAWYGAAAASEGMGRKDEAEAEFKAGIEAAATPDVKRKGQWERGRILLDNGRLDEGVRLLKEQVSAAPMDPMAEPLQLRLAQALLDAGRHTNAVEEFQHYLETYTNRVGQARAQQGKGWGLLKTGRYAEAATAFSRACDLFDDPAARERCLFKVGDAYFANAQYQLASEAFERVLKEGPASSSLRPHALFQLGESLSRAKETARAEKTYQELVEKHAASPFAEEGLLRMAEIKTGGGRWAEALQDYDRFLTVYTNGAFLAEAIHERGVARYRLYRFQEAWEDFDCVMKAFPTNVLAEHALYMRGMCQYGVWRDDEALATCREFLKKYPESQWAPDVRFWIAKYHYNQKAYGEAEKAFLEFVEKHGTNALSDEALLFAGKSAGKRNEYVRAVDLLAQFVKKYGESPRVWEARVIQAEALSMQGNYPGAILVLDEVTNRGPSGEWTAAAWIRKGDFQIMLGAEDPKRYEEGIRSFRAALGVPGATPDQTLEAEYKIGRCLEKKLNRPDEAFEQYHEKVMVRFLDDRQKGRPLDERCKDWFTKAAFDAASVLEGKEEWRKAIHVLQRVVDAGVPAADEARERIRKIRADKWHLLN